MWRCWYSKRLVIIWVATLGEKVFQNRFIFDIKMEDGKNVFKKNTALISKQNKMTSFDHVHFHIPPPDVSIEF